MAALKWHCVTLMALLSLTMCSAHRVKSLIFAPPMHASTNDPKSRLLDENTSPAKLSEGHVLGGGSGYGHGGGGGGGGWSSGGPGGGGYGFGYGHGSGGGSGGGWGSGGSSGSGYGYGGGYGSGGSGEYYPPGFMPGIDNNPFHCQPINCGDPYRCGGFLLHLTAPKAQVQAKDTMNDAEEHEPSKKNHD